MQFFLRQLFKLGIINLLRGQLVRVSSFMFIASLTSGLLGYVYQIIISTLLNPADFGLVSAFMALMSLLIVPLGAYNMILTRGFSAHHATGIKDGLLFQFKRAWRDVAVAAVVVVFCFKPFYGVVAEYLGSPSQTYVIIFTLMVSVVILTVPNAALLQATQNFAWVAANGIIGQLGKLIIGFFLILAGWSVNGVLSSIIATTFITLLINALVVRKYFNGVQAHEVRLSTSTENFKTIFPVLIANIAFAALSQLDLILVKANFVADVAGAFAVAAVFGKAVMYLPGAIVVALYPMVAENEANHKSSIGLLFHGLVITFALSSAGGIFYYFISDFLIVTIYGQKYPESIEILRYYSLAMIPMAIVMVMEYFLMAKRRVLFAYLMLLVVPVEVMLIELFHQTLMQVVYVMTVCGWMLVGVGFMILLWQNKARALQLMKNGLINE